MFLGEFECKIDNKNRFFMPSSFRKGLSEVVITLIDEDTLVIRNSEGWTSLAVLGSNISISSDKLSLYKSYIESNSETIKVDSQGRVLIPLSFIKCLSFSKDIIVVGRNDSIVVMDKLKYLEEKTRVNREWKEFLESNQGIEFKNSLVFKKR